MITGGLIPNRNTLDALLEVDKKQPGAPRKFKYELILSKRKRSTAFVGNRLIRLMHRWSNAAPSAYWCRILNLFN